MLFLMHRSFIDLPMARSTRHDDEYRGDRWTVEAMR